MWQQINMRFVKTHRKIKIKKKRIEKLLNGA